MGRIYPLPTLNVPPLVAVATALLLPAGPLPSQAAPQDAIAAALAPIGPSGPGCSAAVERNGVLLASGAAGLADLALGVAVTPSTVFYAGSVSKQFVAAAVLLLEERGLLRLDAPVGDFIPELAVPLGRVSLRHLLHHTGGVPDYLSLATRGGRDWSDRFGQAEALALLTAADSTEFEPGTRWRYSNGGYLLLAEVVTRLGRTPFRAFADSALLDPLAMRDSHFHDDLDHPIAHLATGYRTDSTGTATPWPLAFAAVGSGGLYTTVLDLARWSGNWWHNRLGTADPGLAQRLSARGTLTSGDTLSYAMGVIIGQIGARPIRRHGGGLAGYRAAVLQFPLERLGIAVLCNSDRGDADAVAERIAARFFAAP
jgi:CubicO group peptidase (beta-lactamase class C family)